MIDIEQVLAALRGFTSYPSVDELTGLADEVCGDARFSVRELGATNEGRRVSCIRFGTGRIKAMIVGGPHAMEPIGALTVTALIDLYRRGVPAICEADIEWHVIPCIDPDGAALNEGWTQQPFTFRNYMEHRFVQSSPDQVDSSFPIAYKALSWTAMSPEAAMLKTAIDDVLPDFFFSLHNAWYGGAFYYLSRDLGPSYYEQFYALLKARDCPVQTRPIFADVCTHFAPGVIEMMDIKRWYDHVENTTANPVDFLSSGTGSHDYLASIKPEALTFIAEIGYAVHPDDDPDVPALGRLRDLLVHLEADNKLLATVLLEEWEALKETIDVDHPIARAIAAGRNFPLTKAQICEGAFPISWYSSGDILFNAQHDHPMSKTDFFNACLVDCGLLLPLYSYQFVRLLRASPQTAEVQASIERLEVAMTVLWNKVDALVNFDRLRVFPLDDLAAVQLGSGLIALNALLAPVEGAQAA